MDEPLKNDAPVRRDPESGGSVELLPPEGEPLISSSGADSLDSDDLGFGQADPTDGRRRWEWRSKYPPAARKGIKQEAWYLATLLLILPIVMGGFWLEFPRAILAVPEAKYRTLLRFGFAWAAGTLGGVLFDLKWLYHSVARGLWHLDRRLWRIFTPHISGGLSFCMLALVSSGALRIFDRDATHSLSLVLGFGFLVGYFSDSAIAKLNDVADTLFGTVQSKGKSDGTDDDPQAGDHAGLEASSKSLPKQSGRSAHE